jgi:hypothetical protein
MSNLAWDYGMPRAPFAADFYQLAEFADPDRVRRHLSAGLAVCCDSYTIDNVWYIPSRSLHVVYRLPDHQIVAVQFLQPGQSSAAFASARAASSRPELVYHLPAWDAVAWSFCADPRLPGIPALTARSAALAGASGWLDPRVLSYLPGERCAIRCQARAGAPGVVGKLRRGPGARASHHLASQLWNAPRRHFRMPEPIAADEALGARWERFVPGRRLEAALDDGTAGTLLPTVVAALVNLHSIQLAGLPTQHPAQILGRIEKVLRRVRAALPELSAPADALARDLAAAAVDLPASQPATLHGDLHTANVVVGDQGPVFIDLDSLAAGDPAFDLALLGGRSLLSALSRGDRVDAALALMIDLPNMYASAGGTPIEQRSYAWYMAALLLGCQIKTCIRHAAPVTGRIAPVLLDLARAMLECGSAAGAPDVFLPARQVCLV